MIDTNSFIYVAIMMSVFTGFLLWRHGVRSYDEGFMDAIQLHKEERLTYTVTHDDSGCEVIVIEVSD